MTHEIYESEAFHNFAKYFIEKKPTRTTPRKQMSDEFNNLYAAISMQRYAAFEETKKELLINQATEYDGYIESQILPVWGAVLADMHALLIYAVEECQAASRKNLENSDKGSYFTHYAIHHLFSRACGIYEEIVVLLRSGYADGAHARWRTMSEVSVVADFIIEYGEAVAEAFVKSETETNEWAKKATCFSAWKKGRRVQIKDLYEKSQRNLMGNYWYQQFRGASRPVHAAPLSLFNRLSWAADSLNFGPSIRGIEVPAALTVDVFCYFFARHMELYPLPQSFIANGGISHIRGALQREIKSVSDAVSEQLGQEPFLRDFPKE